MTSSRPVMPTDCQYRLTLVISSMNAGGAQRVMALLANHWAEQGWSLTLLTFDDGSQPPFFQLHSSIDHRTLNLYAESGDWRRRISNNFRRLFYLRRAIVESRPQAVVSFIDRTNILVICATLLLRVPVIVSEHTAVGFINIGRIWEGLRHFAYPRSAAVVVLTERSRQILPAGWRRNVTVIPNPIVLPPGSGVAPRSGGGKLCVAMGSLCREKGFDLLLQAFAEVAKTHPEWHLCILGEGPLRLELEQLSCRLGIGDRVKLAGLVSSPGDYLQGADLFVLSSRLEGFPLALCEAMACGLPVIATDCATGPREIIRPELDGLLIETENVPALAAAMARLMDDTNLRKALGKRAPDVLERFNLARIADLWRTLLGQVVVHRR